MGLGPSARGLTQRRTRSEDELEDPETNETETSAQRPALRTNSCSFMAFTPQVRSE